MGSNALATGRGDSQEKAPLQGWYLVQVPSLLLPEYSRACQAGGKGKNPPRAWLRNRTPLIYS